MSSTSCVVSLKNGDECDSFHGMATIKESDRHVASWYGHVWARAGEIGRAGECRCTHSGLYWFLVVNSTARRRTCAVDFDVF